MNTTGDTGEPLQVTSQSVAPGDDYAVSSASESRLPVMNQMDEQNNVSGHSRSPSFGTNESATQLAPHNSNTAPASISASQLQSADIEAGSETSDGESCQIGAAV
ncbi:hypothetical protein V6N13_102996 [Hibiscus sabdariffa]